MKKILVGMGLCTVVLSVAVAAEISWPTDFDSNVAARETARAGGLTSSYVDLGAVDARQCDGGCYSYASVFCGTFFDLYASAGVAFDPSANVGMKVFYR